ncbi:MAG: radical SAM protein [Planctomycetota bacterium]|nr:radical SAM protein [Planctomycetota bacterium]
MNVTAGCMHDCAYCYIKGYSQYPGDKTVVLYTDTAERVAQELKRKRSKPRSVYFCPSSDAFQPRTEILDESYRTMRILLEADVGVEFVTKGEVPRRFLDLFASHRGLVSGQVGLITLDDDLNHVLEPGAPSAGRRLATVRRLIRAGVRTSLRIDPIIHGVTDSDQQLARLLSAARFCGVSSVSASFLFLRPAIRSSLRRGLAGDPLLARILRPFDESDRQGLRGGSRGAIALPAETRRVAFARITDLAQRNGLELRICGCKNSDLVGTRCSLVREMQPLDSTSVPPGEQSLPWPTATSDPR